jgi:hypothetical protein
MAQHTHYWSCSKFADWLRGTNKLGCGTSKEWYEWEKASKATHPFRFWVAEEFLGDAQDFVTYPIRKIYDLKYYINNRYVTRTHSLTAHPRDIKPGQWRDVGNRFLPCLFNELVDFVEIESAWSHIAWGDKKDRAKYEAPFWSSGWFRWRTWRCPQAGLDHLDWAMTLTMNEWLEEGHEDWDKPTSQAVRAKELKELYVWWTTVYHARVDPHDASGWSAFCDGRRESDPEGGFMSMFEDRTEEERAESGRILDLCHEIEKQHEDEDTEMMIRLIKIRDGLWT